MSQADLHAKRPISPHLQIYRLIPTMLMSIIHRITGAALYFGTILFVWWLVAAASGPRHLDFVNAVFTSWFGMLVLFGFTWALMHHMLGGIRHLVWDTGKWLGKETSTRLAWLTLIGSVSLTVLVWIIAFLA
jgi:succinate dehydrogenase / fumarate reductase, cytochrome b subunit